MAKLPVLGLQTHKQRVKALYKQSLRCLEAWYDRREVYRYEAVLMRDRFDQNKDVKSLAVASELVAKGEEELFQKGHWQPRKFPKSPGGVAYEREVIPPDWVLDYWHPLEKAEYPEYFARREERKKEFIKNWVKKYGHTSVDSSH